MSDIHHEPVQVFFKIMHCKTRRAIPWGMIAPHEDQARKNHGQSLQRLNERGGLSPAEAVAVLEGREWTAVEPEEGYVRLEELVMAWERNR